MRGGALRFFRQPGEAAGFSAAAAVGGLEQGEMWLEGRAGAAAHSAT